MKHVLIWNRLFLTILAVGVLGFVACGGDDEEDVTEPTDTAKPSTTDTKPQTGSQMGTVRGAVRFQPKEPEVSDIIAVDVNEETGEISEVKVTGKSYVIDGLAVGTYTVTIKDNVENSPFSPIEEKGVKVVAGDFVVVAAGCVTGRHASHSQHTKPWPRLRPRPRPD